MCKFKLYVYIVSRALAYIKVEHDLHDYFLMLVKYSRYNVSEQNVYHSIVIKYKKS